MLGYENFAQMSMETKMAGSVENVMSMIERFVRIFENPNVALQMHEIVMRLFHTFLLVTNTH